MLGELKDSDRLICCRGRDRADEPVVQLDATPAWMAGKFDIIVVERRNLGTRLQESERDDVELRGFISLVEEAEEGASPRLKGLEATGGGEGEREPGRA